MFVICELIPSPRMCLGECLYDNSAAQEGKAASLLKLTAQNRRSDEKQLLDGML